MLGGLFKNFERCGVESQKHLEPCNKTSSGNCCDMKLNDATTDLRRAIFLVDFATQGPPVHFFFLEIVPLVRLRPS